MVAYTSVILGAVLFTAGAYYLFSSEYLVSRAGEDMKKTARLADAAITRELRSMSLYSRLLSSNYSLRDGILSGNAGMINNELESELELLNVDFISVAGANGIVMGTASRLKMGESAAATAMSEPLFLSHAFQKAMGIANGAYGVEPVFPNSIAALAVSPVYSNPDPCEGKRPCAPTSAAPSSVIGYIRVGIYLDKRFVKRLSRMAGTEIAIAHRGVYIASTGKTRADKLNESPGEYLKDYLVMRAPIPAQEKETARLLTLYPREKIYRIQRRGMATIAAIAMFSIVGFLIVSAWVARKITDPIMELSAGVRRIEEGDLEHMIPHTGRDELGALAKSFNRMTESLRKRDEELKKNQQQIIESGKLAAVGELAAGVAHEIGNPLAAISGYLQLLHEAPPEKFNHYIIEIAKETGYIDSIIRQLLEFSRKSDSREDAINLDDAVMEAVRMISFHKTVRNLEIVHEKSEIPVIIEGSHRELLQAIMNITLNAAQAMDGNGRVIFKTEIEDGKAELTISDNGPGIPRKHLPRIFDPFFTTKRTGTGLGLSITFKIIQNHRGSIRVESSVETGTSFIMTFPLSCETRVSDK